MEEIWQTLPFVEMLSHRTNGERQFIEPTISVVEDMNGYRLLFYANTQTEITLEVFIDETSGLIQASHFIQRRGNKKPLFCAFDREKGETAWHNYCLLLYRQLYKDFLL